MRIFYNGKCIRPVSKDCAMKPKASSNVVKKQLVAEYKFDKSIYDTNTDSHIYQIPKPISFNYSGFIDTGIQLLKNDSDWTIFLDCIPNIDSKTQAVIHCIDEYDLCPGISLSFEPNGCINIWDGIKGTVIGQGNYLNKNIKIVMVKKDNNIIIYHNDDPIYQMSSPVTIPYTFKSVNSTLSIGGHREETSLYPFTGAINNFVVYNKALEAQECNSIINNGLLPEIASSIYQIPESIAFNNSGFTDTGIQLLKNDSNWSLFLDCIPNLNNKTQAVIHCVDEYGTFPGISFSFESNGNIGFYDGTKGTVIGSGDYLNKNIKIIIVKKDSNILVYHNNDPIYQATSPVTIPYTFKGANTTLSIGGGHNGASALHTFSGVINNFVIYNEALEAQECNSIINNGLLPKFNNEFTNYEIVDTVHEEIITRSIYSTELPTLIRFDNYGKLTLLEVNYLNVSNTTNLSYIFNGCSNLKYVNTSDWDTSNVTNMYYMFYNCHSLAQLNLSNFNTSKVANMGYMFANNTSLKNLNIANFDLNKTTGLSNLFTSCNGLDYIDCSNVDAYSVKMISGLLLNRTNQSAGTVVCKTVLGTDTLNTLSSRNWNVI